MTCQEEFTYYISPDGIEYDFSVLDGTRWLLSNSGHGMPDIDYLSQRGPFQIAGETALDYRLQPRFVDMVYRNQKASRRQYWNARAKLLNVLRPNRQAISSFLPGRLRKVLPDGAQRDLDVFIKKGPNFSTRGRDWDEWALEDKVTFYAPDPTYYDPTLQTATWGAATVLTQLRFPFTFGLSGLLFGTGAIDSSNSITYDGTWLSYPTIIVTGPIASLVISNETTNETLTLLQSIPDGRTVTFTMDYGEKTVIDSAGNNLIGSLSTDSDLATFHIAPDPEATGGVNTLSVSGSEATAATSIQVQWYTRYIGL